MTRVLERLPLRSKLLMLVGLPLAVVLVFSVLAAVSARSDIGEARSSERSAEVSVAIGNLLHETQKERGGSADSTLLAAISVIESETDIAELGRATTAYRSILSGKEASGITRAQLSNVFTNDAFGEGQLPTIVSLLTRQREYLGQFDALAAPELSAAYQEWSAAESTLATHALENEAVANGVAGFGNDPVAWFETKTVYIDGLKAIEDMQAAALLTTSRDLAGSATFRFWLLLAGCLASLAVTVLFGQKCAASVTGPLDRVGLQASRISEGDLDVDLLEMTGADEVAVLARSFDTMTLRLRQSSAEAAELIEAMNDRASQLVVNADTLTDVSSELADGADETAIRASSVSAASEQASAISKSVSSAVEQLQETIAIVVDQAKSATTAATEVKSLASQTNDATGDIRGRVARIQSEVAASVSAIDEITDVVAAISTDQRSVSESVAEQNHSTVEIAAAVADVASTSAAISMDITAVAAASDQTSTNAVQTRRAATEVMRLASELADIRESQDEHVDALV